MQNATSLDTLLEHIRLRGIPVGVAELQRLQAVFRRAPGLSRGELLGLLQTVLAKDETQRRSIERLFETLLPFEGEETPGDSGESPARQAPTQTDASVEASPAGDSSDAPQPKKPRKPLNVLAIGLALLVIVAGVLLAWAYFQQEKAEDRPNQPISFAPAERFDDIPKIEKKPNSDLKLVKTIERWFPTITKTQPIYPVVRMLPSLALLLGAGLGCLWLWHQARRRIWVREPEPPHIRHKGKSFLPPLQGLADYHLLGSEARREMGWGISHYLSDQPLSRLDIERSVAETARSGLPSIHFRTASREREVWLWQDQGSTNPDLSRLADEVTSTLQAVNIQVQRGYFHGVPSRVVSPQGEVVWSIRYEYPENQPLVVVLCDHDSLMQMEAAHADEQHSTFRLLGHWANLCLVDGSPQPGALCRKLQPYALECLLPQDVPGWLAQQGRQREIVGNVCPLDELHRWALACALPERPLMEAEIRALHEALRLDCAWQYHSLKRYARESGTGFDFAHERRGLLQEFAQLARAGNADVGRALAFWRGRYAEIERELAARETQQRPWKESRRQRLLEVEVALLGVWGDAEEKSPLTPLLQRGGQENRHIPASPFEKGGLRGISSSAEQLYDLHSHADLRKEVERKLGVYACLDWPELPSAKDKWIRLPFRWGDLTGQTRKQLLAAGFGGKAQNLKLRWDKATGILLGVLAGLALAGFVGSAWALRSVPVQVKVQLNSTEPTEKIQRWVGDDLLLGTAKGGWIKPQETHDDEIVWVKWQPETRSAREIVEEGDEVELWFAGENGKPERPPLVDWPVVSVAVIAESPDDPDTQRLAAKLLDSGTVDQVLIGKKWCKHQADIMQQWQGLPGMQWLYVNAEPPTYAGHAHIAHFKMQPAALLAKLQKPGVHEAASVQAGATVKGNPRLMGFTPDRESLELPQGMKLMPIPQGSFQMGSEKYDSEKPIHTVTINHDFWMSATEVTFAQYDAYVAAVKGQEKPSDSGWGRYTRPVINVSWDDVQGYVKWLSDNNGQGLSCRLPSEAEWEYAARAGTTTDYFWGDEVGKNNEGVEKPESDHPIQIGQSFF